MSGTPDNLVTPPGVNPEVAAQRGYRHLPERDALIELPPLGFADYQARGSGLLVPMWDASGENGAYQFRPDTPRTRDGKPIKYETPGGQRNMLDVHPSKRELLHRADVHLIFTEGVKKADALTSIGYCAVALSGVWNWRSKDGPLGDFENVVLRGRDVSLIFDSDARTNPNVRLALERFAEFLRSRGAASVRLVLPPAGPHGEKQGVDDFLARGGTMEALYTMPENTPREADELFDSWEPVNLAELGQRDPTLPDMAGDTLPICYPGKRHVYSGPPESLKTMLAYAALLHAVRNGKRAGVLNFEMDAHDARDMFRDLGATDDELAQIVYRSPERGPTRDDIARLVDERLDAVLIDAGAGMYAIDGVDDNQRGQVEETARKWTTPLWKAGIATITLDHEPKSGSTWAIGSERKVGQADVHLRFEAAVTLTRGGKGVVNISVEKDRPGYIRRTAPHGLEVYIESQPLTNTLTYKVTAHDATTKKKFRPTGLMEKASRIIEEEGGRSKNAVAKEVGGKKEYALAAIDRLVDEGFVLAVEAEQGKAHGLHHVKPFTEHDDKFGPPDAGATKL
jgi:hypothetical protein